MPIDDQAWDKACDLYGWDNNDLRKVIISYEAAKEPFQLSDCRNAFEREFLHLLKIGAIDFIKINIPQLVNRLILHVTASSRES